MPSSSLSSPSSSGPTELSSDVLNSRWVEGLAPNQMFDLSGKVAVVTGAAGGIGRWLSAGLAGAGAQVLLTDREAKPLEALGAALSDRGWTAAPLEADLEDPGSPERIVRGAIERFGQLDILINNAGINRRIPMLEVSRAELEHHWQIDYIRQYELAQVAARAMIDQGQGGAIVHISSLNNAFGLEDVSLVGPAKAALSQLTKGMAIELARFNIRTNAIAPGFMATPMNATHWTHETRAPWIMDRTPICRPGHPAELVGACLLLVSAAGSFINGQTIYVDGGFTAGSRWNVPPGTGLQAYREHGGYCQHQAEREATE